MARGFCLLRHRSRYLWVMANPVRLSMPFPPPEIDVEHPERHIGDPITYNGDPYVTTGVERDPKTKRGLVYWAVPARP